MKMTEHTSALLRERYVRIDHPSGLPIYVFPKPMTGIYAILSVKYGSTDNTVPDADGILRTVPDGVAHFLEHKLFDNADGTDSFANFSACGADANAYTTYDRTAYLFNCTNRFSESLTELLTFVTHPYFTPESVQKERGIIAEEIRMYEDSPWERCYQNLLSAMYRNNPVRRNICGSEKSIAKITDQLLYTCYRQYYRLSNMALVVCGEVTPSEVTEVADRVLTGAGEQSDIRHETVAEPTAVFKSDIRCAMQVPKPVFSIGIKDSVISTDPVQRTRREAAMTLLDEILFSRSGDFYSGLFESGVLTPSFSYGYSMTERFAFHCISGEADDPELVLKLVKEQIERVREKGVSQEEFERCRRVLYADEIRGYDSTEEIANNLLSFVFDGTEMFSYPEVLESIRPEELNALLRDAFRDEYFTLSVIIPLPETDRGKDITKQNSEESEA